MTNMFLRLIVNKILRFLIPIDHGHVQLVSLNNKRIVYSRGLKFLDDDQNRKGYIFLFALYIDFRLHN